MTLFLVDFFLAGAATSIIWNIVKQQSATWCILYKHQNLSWEETTAYYVYKRKGIPPKKQIKKRRKENQVDNHVRCKHISWSDYMIKHKFHKFIPNSKRAWKNSLQLSEILWKRNYKYLMIWKHVFGTIRLYWCDPLVESFFNLNYIWLYICINLISIPCV